MANEGINALTKEITNVAYRIVNQKNPPAMLGTIQGNMSLRLGNVIIPAGAYMVLDTEPAIKAGDLVLCVTVGDNGRIVVVGRIK